MSGGGDFGRAAVRAAIGLGKGATGGAVSPHPPPPSTPAASLLLLAIYSDRRRPSSPPDSPGRNLTTSGHRHHRHLSPPLLIASSRAPPTPQQTRQWRAPRRRRRGWTSTTSSTACAAPTSPSPDPACRCTGNADRLPPRIWPSPPPASPDPGSSPPDPASPPSDSALSADFRPPPVAVTHSSPDPAVSSARDRRAVARGRRAVRSPAWSGRLHLGPDPKGMGVMLEQCSCSQGSGFKLIWNSVKGFLDPKTSSKIHVLGSNYQSRLLEVIDSSELPEFLGGSCTCGDKGGCLGSNKGPWNDPFILKLVHNLEAGFAREIKPISDGEESNSSLRLEQLKWQGMISDTSNAESGSDVDDFGSSFFQKAADYGCLTPVHEERPDSDFKRRLMEVLLKPISRREYIKLFDMASIRTPLVKLRQVRNDVKFYPTDEMGNSYFDHYPGHGLPDMTYGSSLQPIEG